MPNHVANRLNIKATEETLKKIKDLLASTAEDGNVMSFESFFPTPQECLDNGDKWYYWRIANWGTKWDCYDSRLIDDFTYEFNTAWSTPRNAILRLSILFPDALFTVDYADEDASYNCGRYAISNGEYTEDWTPEGDSLDAWNQFFNLHEGAEEDYVLTEDGQHYRYKFD